MIREHLVDQNQHKELGHGIIGTINYHIAFVNKKVHVILN